MPNNTANILTISGDDFDKVKLCARRLQSAEHDIDFNKILPLPEELLGRTYTYTCKRDFYGVPEELTDSLICKYGFGDWYNWSISNWDTKWNAYNDEEWKFDDINKTASIYFETAWSPPINLILLLSECKFGNSWHTIPSFTFPELIFKLEYADEGAAFLGYHTFEDRNAQEYALEWKSTEGIELRKKLRYYWEEDE